MYRKSDIESYLLQIDGKKTFAGILLEYWDKNPGKGRSISKTLLAETTVNQYLDEIIDNLLPLLEVNQKTMEEYDREYFEKVLESLRRNRFFSQSTIERYRRNIRRTYQAGVDAGEYEGTIIWDDADTIQASVELENQRRSRLIRKKSLEIDQEIKMIKWFLSLDPRTVSGTEIGIMLMMFLGLRNGEACGVQFGDIAEVDGKYHCIYIMRTTEAGTGNIKLGGKTRNAFRIIPLYDFLYNFLQERKEYVRKVLSEGPSTYDLEDKLRRTYIASKDDLQSNLNAADLTAAGKIILRNNLGIDPATDKTFIASKDDYLQKLSQIGIGEKEPTAYLFRRNYATHACNLGLNAGEVEFLIGHNIEETGVYRHFFNSGDSLRRICEIMENHPFCLLHEIIGNWNKPKPERIKSSVKESEEEHHFIMRVVTNEPLDTLNIKLDRNQDVSLKGRYSSLPMLNGYPDTVNIRETVKKIYETRIREYYKNGDTSTNEATTDE